MVVFCYFILYLTGLLIYETYSAAIIQSLLFYKAKSYETWHISTFISSVFICDCLKLIPCTLSFVFCRVNQPVVQQIRRVLKQTSLCQAIRVSSFLIQQVAVMCYFSFKVWNYNARIFKIIICILVHFGARWPPCYKLVCSIELGPISPFYGVTPG